MKTLFIGGTGIISSACVELAKHRGDSVTVLNRGNSKAPEGVDSVVADVNDLESARAALSGRTWDAVVDFTVFDQEQARSRIDLFAGATGQYVFISSASAYQKPVVDFRITEETPLENPFWEYSREKANCEGLFMEAHKNGSLPVTIVRPSLTYGATHVPLVLNSWRLPYTLVDRMRRGAPVIVPGDGSSLWSITHSDDFAKGLVGLLGCAEALGEDFHITTDEVLTWDQYFSLTAQAAGAPAPDIVHIASDFIISCMPDKEGSLLGDKAVSVVFDNTKIKRVVPDFVASIPFSDGIRRSILNMDADESLRSIDEEANRAYDKLISVYRAGLDKAKQAFANP
ncbi:NAD-dependent epimerase/dehydratase family protein [Pelagicoccus mobilis]|uniref:NAD-dependent epimerase/dehydratase family protein n=1 Tax=Pelagicoccus mobilis TaxID=415221 RepID=A0A934RY86_9BACT|nr:NAD-dependent epimerase/dehydratase family protein [Pelagicoccus mobilis]MBK1877036.1 NAD-dependent epimerase/dehydratase family protein [Pelagicoccus mobilis]